MYWFEFSQDRNRWRAFVNVAMKLGVSYKAKRFLE
jgi:hypothetical protein